MKRTGITLILLATMMAGSLAQTLDITFTTQPLTSGKAAEFSPKNIVAVWVETSTGSFVSSVKVMAQERIGWLTKWNSKSLGNKVNAITGSTLLSHQTHAVTWNCKKYNGTIIGAGSYKLFVEVTSGDATGKFAETPFTINADNSMTVQPTTGSNVSNLTLVYTPLSTGIDPITQNISHQDVAQASPNPFSDQTEISFFTKTAGPYTIELLNTFGQTIYRDQGVSMTGKNSYQVESKKANTGHLDMGTYFCILKTKDYSTSVKVLKK